MASFSKRHSKFQRADRLASKGTAVRWNTAASASMNCRKQLLFLTLAVLPSVALAADRDWPVYLGDKANTHFSQLKQITPRNVHQLEVAWTYHSGDARQDNLSQ